MAEVFKIPSGMSFAPDSKIKATASLKDKTALYWLLYSASDDDREEIYDEYMARHYEDVEVAKKDVLPLTWFVCDNIISDIVEKKVAAIPANPDFIAKLDEDGEELSEGSEELSQAVEDVVKSRIWGDSQNFFESQELFNTTLKVEGNLFFKLTKGDGGVEVSVMPTADVNILYDPDNIDLIHGYVFSWTEKYFDDKGEEKSVAVVEAITQDEYLRWEDDKPVTGDGYGAHSLPFIPIEHVKNRPISGSPIGGSDIEDLILPFFEYLEVRNDIRMNNRFLGRPMFKAKGLSGDFIAGPFAIAHLQLSPDSMLERITAGENIQPLENELEREEDFLYRKGRVMRKSAADNKSLALFASARALMTLDREGIRDLAKLLPRLTKGYASLIAKAAYMNSDDIASQFVEDFETLAQSIQVKYPNLEIENLELIADKVKTALILNEMDKISDERLMKQLQRFGYIASDEDIEEILEEGKEESSDKDDLEAAILANGGPQNDN